LTIIVIRPKLKTEGLHVNVSLTKQLEKMVASKVASGMYNSASEVIREALRLLEQKERADREYLERIRSQVADGLKDIEAGNVVAYDKVGLRRRISQIKTKGRKQRKGKNA
jgi:antitoxin ParD1/3/4